MARFPKALVASWLAAGLLAACGVPAPAAEGDAAAIAKDNNAFALDLYAKLSAAKGNLSFSPYSISTALAMTYAGARGQTAAQMANVLHFGPDAPALHKAFGGLITGLNEAGKRGDFSLVVANALWAQQGYKFEQDFLDLVASAYRGGVQEVDFQKATEAARKTINGWVEKQTNDKIQNLIPAGVLDELARLVLTNAMYLKAPWQSPFDEKATREGQFTLLDGSKVRAPLMHQTRRLGYLAGEGFQALELPYKGGSLSMVVFLPMRVDGLPRFEQALTAEKLAGWLAALVPREVVVTLPKFRVASSFNLADALKSLGMTDAFGEGADFSGMNGRRDLFIQAVLHKAYVDVNESGTEAAAATAVVMRVKGIVGREAPIFRADRPFLFLIRDRRSGSILFLGRLMNPTA